METHWTFQKVVPESSVSFSLGIPAIDDRLQRARGYYIQHGDRVIADMGVGETGWIVPWAISDGILDGAFGVSEKSGGTGTLCITRISSEQFEVCDHSHCSCVK